MRPHRELPMHGSSISPYRAAESLMVCLPILPLTAAWPADTLHSGRVNGKPFGGFESKKGVP